MSIVKNAGHQWPLVASADIDFAEVSNANNGVLFELPGDAYVLEGSVLVDTAVTGTTTATVAVAVTLASGDVVVASAINCMVQGRTAFTLTSLDFVLGEIVNVEATFTTTGSAASAGRVLVECQYFRTERATETR